MIENIENLTAEEFLRQQIKKGKILTFPIYTGERIEFFPNAITTEKALKGINNESNF